MSSEPTPPTTRAVTHEPAAQRFVHLEDGHVCVLEYVLHDGVAIFHHTEVPSAVGGRGVAADLVHEGLETARAKGWKVRPTCSYVAAYMRRHPEYQDLLAS